MLRTNKHATTPHPRMLYLGVQGRASWSRRRSPPQRRPQPQPTPATTPCHTHCTVTSRRVTPSRSHCASRAAALRIHVARVTRRPGLLPPPLPPPGAPTPVTPRRTACAGTPHNIYLINSLFLSQGNIDINPNDDTIWNTLLKARPSRYCPDMKTVFIPPL